MVSGVTPYEIGLVLSGTVSIALSGGCLAWILLRATPAALRREALTASTTADLAMRKCEAMEFRFAGWKEELDGYMSAVDDSLARTETKRKRIENAEARAQRRLNGNPTPDSNPEPQTRDDLVAAARRQVYGSG